MMNCIGSGEDLEDLLERLNRLAAQVSLPVRLTVGSTMVWGSDVHPTCKLRSLVRDEVRRMTKELQDRAASRRAEADLLIEIISEYGA
jgi:hypothetical protein